jgi:hypothetical protein
LKTSRLFQLSGGLVQYCHFYDIEPTKFPIHLFLTLDITP